MKTLYYMKRRNKERVHLLTDNVYLEFFSHLFCLIKFIYTRVQTLIQINKLLITSWIDY